MSNIHLRGLDKQLIQKLKLAAADQNVSVNTLILNMIRQGFGMNKQRKQLVYHDLDKLAGTWSTSESKSFLRDISDLEKIDQELWK